MPEKSAPIHVQLIRPDDLLNLEISAVNLRLDATDRAHPVLLVDDAQRPGLLIVGFPAQTVFEEAYFESDANPPLQKLAPPQKHPQAPNNPPVPADPGATAFRLGGRSRLVFRVPADARILYTSTDLLDWSRFELVVAPVADVEFNAPPPAAALTIRAPEDGETSLELPFRLFLSPGHRVAWDHARVPVSHGGRVELWHTRLVGLDRDGRVAPVDDEHLIGLRAIWSPDYVPGGPVPAPTETGLPGAITPMNVADRHQIVVLTSAFEGYAETVAKKFVPEPIWASMVMLSPLGGWLRSFGAWNPPARIKPPAFRSAVDIGDLLVDHDEVIRQGPVSDRPNGRVVPNEVLHAVHPDLARELEARLAGDVVAAEAGVTHGQHADRLQLGGRARAMSAATTTLDPNRFGLVLYDIDEGARLDLSQWAHIAAQGRDHYVRLVYEGRLCDTGHPASLVKVTERRFELSPDGNPVAYLRQYMYIVVREPELVYPNLGLADDGRGMPFKRIRLTTLVSPHIDYPYKIPNNPYVPPGHIPSTDRSFWVTVGQQDFLFHGIAEDIAGNVIDFAKPMIFVPNSETSFAAIQTAITTVAGLTRKQALVPSQRVAFAEPDAVDGKDNTSFVTESFVLGNEGATRDTFFKPRLFKADVRIPAIEALTGAAGAASIALAPQYLTTGFGDAANRTDTFATVVTLAADGALRDAGSNAKFQAAQAGGLATPQLDVTCLTRAVGPLGGTLADALTNTFDPTTVFKGGLATLFGVFDLRKVLPNGGSADADAPKMQVHREGTAVITELKWASAVNPLEVGIVTFTPHGSRLTVHAVIRKEPAGDGTMSLDGALNTFDIEFLNSLVIKFASFTFASRTGSKTTVDVALDPATPVQFVGDLSFVEGLRKLIPPGVFGDGVSIDLIQNPLGVKAGLTIGLPPATVGVFSLKNIAFSAGLTIPFLDGKPVAEFGFARRDAQFLLAVLIFGGGGFFHLEIDTDGVRMLEAAFEFGATAALDIGVASGEVHIMAGVYFKMEKRQIEGTDKMVASLSGYLRCGGSLSVLGLVRISVEFYLSFTYYPEPLDKAKGRATLTVEVEVACFSKSVELTVERAIGGKGGDPTFEQMMDAPALWADYANAFA